MQVREIMTQDVACCTPDTALTEVARMMVECDCGAIPVVERKDGRKKLVGMVTDRDIVCRTLAEGKNPVDLTAGVCMSQGVVTARPEESVEECCQKMEEHQVRRILVTDENDECCGIVAQADIAQQAPEHETAEVVKDVSKPTGSPRQGCC